MSRPGGAGGGRKKPMTPRGAAAMFQQMDKANNPTSGNTQKLSVTKNTGGIKDTILLWCQHRTKNYKDVNVENFSTSWNDGLAFCALIHSYYPSAFDFDQLERKNRADNFKLAFETAEKEADIAPLLEVEDMVRMKKPDWKSVFTYVQFMYQKLMLIEKKKRESESDASEEPASPTPKAGEEEEEDEAKKTTDET